VLSRGLEVENSSFSRVVLVWAILLFHPMAERSPVSDFFFQIHLMGKVSKQTGPIKTFE